MTFDLRKFERVWEKCGERPDDLMVKDGHWFVYNADAEWTLIEPETAAAIIRDWAVGWLAKQPAEKVVPSQYKTTVWKLSETRSVVVEDTGNTFDTIDGGIAIGTNERGQVVAGVFVCHGAYSDKWQRFRPANDAGDLTESLFLACCKVLGIEP